MQSRHRAPRDLTEEGERQKIDVKMQDIKIVGLSAHMIEHDHIVWNGVLDLLVEP